MSDVHSTLHVHEPDGRVTPADDDRVVREALARLDARVRHEPVFDHPGTVKAWFALRLGTLEHEVFAVAFLDTRLCLIAYDEMFRGTLTMTAVYPREVVKRALACNASAVLLAHNHPSGNPAPSEADRQITRRLADALALVDVRVLDHIVVAAGQGLSFAEHGLL